MLLVLLSVAAAQEASFAGTDVPGQKFETPERYLTATVGGTLTSGNTAAYAVNVASEGYYRWKRNKLGGTLGANLGRGIADTSGDGRVDDAERAAGWVDTARNVNGLVRYDRFIGERDSLYALAGGLHDPFAGYDYRVNGQLGYSRILVETKKVKLYAEVGFDVAREDYILDVDPNSALILAARELVGLEVKFNENVAVTEKFEAYENVLEIQDLRFQNDISLSAKLTDKLSWKISDTLRYDNVPVEGFQKIDNVVTTGLVVSFL